MQKREIYNILLIKISLKSGFTFFQIPTVFARLILPNTCLLWQKCLFIKSVVTLHKTFAPINQISCRSKGHKVPELCNLRAQMDFIKFSTFAFLLTLAILVPTVKGTPLLYCLNIMIFFCIYSTTSERDNVACD